MAKDKKVKSQTSDDEIDLIELAKTIWDGRKLIITIVAIFAFLGLAIAFFLPKEYTASTTMVPQVSGNNSKLGGLSSLASLAGFNLDVNMQTTELSPYVYPQIVQSVPFQLEIMNTPFTFSDVDHPVSIYEYYTDIAKPGPLSLLKKYSIGLPGVILKAIRGQKDEDSSKILDPNTIKLSEDQEDVRKIIADNVTLETNDKEGYVVLSSRFREPVLAAEVGQKAQKLLQQYITEYKIEKATAQLEFIKERCAEKKNELELAQNKLAAFRDQNLNITSARAKTEEERLQSDFQLAFDVYSQLAQQLEQAQIKVKEDTPVFSILKPVVVPIEKSSPNRPLILIIWIFLGGIIGIGWIFGKHFLAAIKEKWNNPEDQK